MLANKRDCSARVSGVLCQARLAAPPHMKILHVWLFMRILPRVIVYMVACIWLKYTADPR